MTRAVIAEDSLLVRAGLVAILADCGVEVVAQAADAPGLLAAVRAHTPDLAVIDIRMPPTHTDEGVRMAVRLQREMPELGLLVLSEVLDSAFALQLMQQSARRTAYLLKDRLTDLRLLRKTLDQIRHGEVSLDAELIADLVRDAGVGSVDTLSPTELRVLQLIAQGRTDRAVAQTLLLSPKTVEAHVNRIFRKLDLAASPQDNRRVQAVVRYLRSADPVHQAVPQQRAPTGDPDRVTATAEAAGLLAVEAFDTVATVLEQRSAEAGALSWQLLSVAAWAETAGGRFDRAAVLADRAKSAAEPDGRTKQARPGVTAPAVALTEALSGVVLMMAGRAPAPTQALDLVHELAARPIGHPGRELFDVLEPLVDIGNWFTFADRYADAGEILDRRLDRRPETGLSSMSTVCALVELELRRGRWDRAEALLAARPTTGGHAAGYAFALAARIAAGRSDAESCLQQAQLARAAATARGDRLTLDRADAAEGLLWLGLGDLTTALPLLSGLSSTPGSMTDSVLMVTADLVQALVGLGELQHAREISQQAIGAAAGWAGAAQARCRGLVADTAAEAAKEFERSSIEFAVLGATFEQSRSELLLGQALQEHDGGRGEFHRRRATATLTAIGAGTWAHQPEAVAARR